MITSVVTVLPPRLRLVPSSGEAQDPLPAAGPDRSGRGETSVGAGGVIGPSGRIRRSVTTTIAAAIMNQVFRGEEEATGGSGNW